MTDYGHPFEVRPRDRRPVGDCRECGRPSWHADDGGPVHDCCARYGPDCRSCAASVALDAKQRSKRR